ncbi:hypothetical protein OG21DRAFT_1488305 [Imleria badia]|nr:hypothetical protein OG21DRAFT_1488305 [Imleria badia]
MVLTRSAAKKIALGQVTEDTPVEHAPGNCAPPAKKRRRKDTATSKKQRGGKPLPLAGEACRLNLDVLFLIAAAYIHPIDLLNLARTCKSLRQLLMDRSSAFVWKAARRQVNGLPDCPADLTEHEYANLVFYARCYGCDQYTKTVLWEMRRRYCPDCRIKRFCALSSCHEVVPRNNVLAREHITIEGETTIWVDKEQMESFMHQYTHSSDEKQFLKDKREQHGMISMHARLCEKWRRDKTSERKVDLNGEHDNSILERLKQLGYESEVASFRPQRVQLSCKSVFGKSRPHRDKD